MRFRQNDRDRPPRKYRADRESGDQRPPADPKKGGRDDEMCRKHGTHKWSKCPDNWKNKNENKGERDKRHESHAQEAADKPEPEIFLREQYAFERVPSENTKSRESDGDDDTTNSQWRWNNTDDGDSTALTDSTTRNWAGDDDLTEAEQEIPAPNEMELEDPLAGAALMAAENADDRCNI